MLLFMKHLILKALESCDEEEKILTEMIHEFHEACIIFKLPIGRLPVVFISTIIEQTIPHITIHM